MMHRFFPLVFAAALFWSANAHAQDATGARPNSGGASDTVASPPETQPRGGLPGFHRKAQNGERLRVAYLGGSITAGNGWRTHTLEFLRHTYPRATLEEIFASVPGTGSALGAARLERDVVAREPDLLFVEFAVNDGEAAARVEAAMEGIVRKLWRARPEAEVCFVYTVSRRTIGGYQEHAVTGAAESMERVAAHYGIPTVSFGFEVARQIRTGKMVFEASRSVGAVDAEGRTVFSNDGTHPLAAGHDLYAAVFRRAWPALVAEGRRGPDRSAAPRRADRWENAGIALAADAARTGTWVDLPPDDSRVASQPGRMAPPTAWTDTAGASLQATVNGSVLGVLGIKSAQSGSFRVTVDEREPVIATLRDSFAVPGHYRLKAWFYPEALKPGPHRVKVELLETPASAARTELFLNGILFSGDNENEPGK